MTSENKSPQSDTLIIAKPTQKKMIILLVMSFIALASTGAGVFFVIKKNGSTKHVETHAEKKSDHGDSHAEKKSDHGDSHAEKKSFFSFFKLKTYVDAWKSAEGKAKIIHEALEENQRLRLENSSLRQWAEELKFEYSQKKSVDQTDFLSDRLKKETGTEIGRVLASINYHPPTHLLPEQLLTLSLTYFRTGDYEKSAVIMTYLTSLYNNHSYKNPKYYLVTAMSWYYLKNYNVALDYFKKAIEVEVMSKGTERYKAQAHLGLMFTYEKLKNKKDSQYWARQLVFNYPKSDEAKWINPKGEQLPEMLIERVPASNEVKKDVHHE